MLRHTSPADTAILVRIVVHCSIIATILLHLSEPVSVAVAHSHVISARHSSLVLPQCCVHAPTLASAAILMRINMTATAVPPHPKGTRMARITVSAITRAVHVRAVRVRAVIVHAVRVRAVRAGAVHVRAVRASAVIVVHPHTLEPPVRTARAVPVRARAIASAVSVLSVTPVAMRSPFARAQLIASLLRLRVLPAGWRCREVTLPAHAAIHLRIVFSRP